MTGFNWRQPALFLTLLLVVLHPYTVFGKPGLVLVALFALHAMVAGMSWQFVRDFLVPTLVLLTIAALGALSSVFNGIPQFNHPAAVVSMLIMIVGARGIYLFARRGGVGFDDFLMMLVAVVVINSVIVLLEIQFDPLRQFIESFLDPISGGSINYAQGFRLRGIANSGGASLSVAIPGAFILSLYLFDRQRIGLLALVGILVVLLGSVVVIGRTGIVLMAIPLFGYFVMLLARRGGLSQRAIKTVVALFVLALCAPLFVDFITVFFSEIFGDDFIKYAFGFLLEGGEGIRDEGTVDKIAEFLMVLPLQFPQALTGFGFYGGSDFYPWTDTGYNRTFLSVGFLFGLLFYFYLFRMYLLTLRRDRFLFGAFILLLAVSETKEPLMYSGTIARIFILMLVYAYCERAAVAPQVTPG